PSSPGYRSPTAAPSATSQACSATASTYHSAACATAAQLTPSASRSTPPPATATRMPSCAPDSQPAPRNKPSTPPAPSTWPGPVTNQAHDPGSPPEELTASPAKGGRLAGRVARRTGLTWHLPGARPVWVRAGSTGRNPARPPPAGCRPGRFPAAGGEQRGGGQAGCDGGGCGGQQGVLGAE